MYAKAIGVNKGDVLLRFRTNNSDYKINYQTNRLNDYQAHLTDLAYLAKGECPVVFHSPVRQQEYTYFLSKRKKNWKPLWRRRKKNICAIKPV